MNNQSITRAAAFGRLRREYFGKDEGGADHG